MTIVHTFHDVEVVVVGLTMMIIEILVVVGGDGGHSLSMGEDLSIDEDGG